MGENVAGLLTKTTDDGASKVIDVIQECFAEIGYPIQFAVYDMSTVGVPQSRKRLAMVGNRMNQPFVMPTFAEPKVGLQQILEPTLEGAMETSLDLPETCRIEVPDSEEPSGTPHP